MISGGWNPFSALGKIGHKIIKPLATAGGTAIGGFLGGPHGAAIGGALGGMAGGALSGGGGGGGGGKSGYTSPYTGQLDTNLNSAINQRSSLGFAPLTGQAGMDTATSGFNFQPLNSAISGFSTPNALESYKPAQFNFQSLPKQYEQMAYNISANPIRQEGQNQLTSLKNAIGNRRLGVLAKVGGENQQATNQRLAGLSNQLGLERMQEETNLGQQQQLSQADENMRAAQAAENARQSRLQSLGTLGIQAPTLQSNLLENERAYRDQPLASMQNLYATNLGSSENSANRDLERRAQNFGFLNNALSAAGNIYGTKRSAA